ncbi:hypothetical protein H6P81_004681 [Aristolochia fimbriata]|uniref:PGG domain-containing protein n=1 Tax=Aristolochia fimbriata TaxID=158543 RepID=A0AAV7ESF0_ARIFI|nr:hypothetical protein H6P81_004681 [Aristolochia fimbriata]
MARHPKQLMIKGGFRALASQSWDDPPEKPVMVDNDIASPDRALDGATPERRLAGKKKRLMFEACMSRDWETVKREFRNNKDVRVAKITSSEDTIVHFAVIERRRADVKALIDVLETLDQRRDILLLKNKSGSTPLHLAAAQGDWEMCEVLASVAAKDLIASRNADGETPLFVAALHGKMEPFFVLLNKLREDNEIEQIDHYIRRNDGNTILHVAILGEHFDLAFQIIKIYQDVERNEENVLVNTHNEKGQSALHILAKSAHAFRSGYYYSTIDKLIYSLSWADRLEKIDGQSFDPQPSDQHEEKSLFPENYSTCVDLVKPIQDLKNSDACRKFCDFFLKPFRAIGMGGRCKGCINREDPENPAACSNGGKHGAKEKEMEKRTGHVALKYLPANYAPLFLFFRLAMMISLVFLGLGFWRLKRIRYRKQRHTWAVQIMEELVKGASAWEYNADGKKPDIVASSTFEFSDNIPLQQQSTNHVPDMNPGGEDVKDAEKPDDMDKSETPILVAAKSGVVEMVEHILGTFPVAIRDVNKDGKNVVLLAVENRQPFVYKLLMRSKYRNENVFQKVDDEGNSALHLAAVLGTHRPWIIPGAALQMQWEIKWFKFVKESVQPYFFIRVNNKGRTATETFNHSHRKLVGEGGQWLNTTSKSCSLVAALIATVAFAAAVTVPGGVKEDKGTPNLEGRPAFDTFAISSLVALGLSVTSLITFLSILTSRHVSKDFEWSLPIKLMIGLTSLFFSISAMLLSFCTGHYFILRNHLRNLAFYMYAVACLPVGLFAFAQFRLYVDLGMAILTQVPYRTYKESFY